MVRRWLEKLGTFFKRRVIDVRKIDEYEVHEDFFLANLDDLDSWLITIASPWISEYYVYAKNTKMVLRVYLGSQGRRYYHPISRNVSTLFEATAIAIHGMAHSSGGS